MTIDHAFPLESERPHQPLVRDQVAPAQAAPETIATWPPLDRVTVLRPRDGHDVLDLTVLLVVPVSCADEPWQAAVWFSRDDGGTWAELGLNRLDDEDPRRPICLWGETTATTATTATTGTALSRRLYFSTSLASLLETSRTATPTSCNFTVKFRSGSHLEWSWARDLTGMGDGTVILLNPANNTNDTIDANDAISNQKEPDSRLLLKDLIPDLDSRWKVTSVLSQTPLTRVWTLETFVGGARDAENSAFVDVSIGVPFGGFLRWFALVRQWTPWLSPRHGRDVFSPESPAIMCSFLSPRGQNLVLLGVSGINETMSTMHPGAKGEISINARNDAEDPQNAMVIMATGADFSSAVAAAMYHARSLVMASMGSQVEKETSTLGEVDTAWFKGWCDGLGYCTWNSLGQHLTHEKIVGAIDSLAENNIRISSLIIDDNWQSIDYRGPSQFQHGWVEFEAEAKGFPGGLKETVAQIRQKHPDIQHVAVWHALLGYWGGICPDGKIAQAYKTTEVHRADVLRPDHPLRGSVMVVDEEDVGRMYNDFYAFLKSCGVDSVKTDVQFMLDTVISPAVRRRLTRGYVDAWTSATLRHFAGRAISCMSHAPQILFYGLMPRNRPPFLLRSSDDFYPDVPASHPWHLWANAHNLVLAQYLNVLPDWDMFQTAHPFSAFHAAARCISGGPVYITDAPGEHDPDLLCQMTGVTPRGKTVVFRPSVVARTVDAYTGYHDCALLKIGSYHGSATTGTPILGIFNISTRPVTELVALSSFLGILPGLRYVVRAHTTGLVSAPVAGHAALSVHFAAALDVGGYDIMTAYPLLSSSGGRFGEVLVANLGLVGKMSGAAAIVVHELVVVNDGSRLMVDTKLKALGTLGIYISTLPNLSLEADFIATMQGQVIPPHTVKVSAADARVLEVDIEQAWVEMGLESRWSNEVGLKLYFTK